MEASQSLEVQLVAALLAGNAPEAQRVATELHQRGFEWGTVALALQDHPQLEEPLWELLNAVIPLPRRVAKRRAIRAAEKRDWGNWEEGKRKS